RWSVCGFTRGANGRRGRDLCFNGCGETNPQRARSPLRKIRFGGLEKHQSANGSISDCFALVGRRRTFRYADAGFKEITISDSGDCFSSNRVAGWVVDATVECEPPAGGERAD